jgi:prolyl-tRNA synthetase
MNAKVQGPDGKERTPVHMGSYGIGVSRLVGAIIEASHDEAGIIWPESVAPFDVGIVNMKEELYAAHQAAGSTCSMTTPTSARAPKFATADLIGIPWQVIVGPRGVAAGEIEVKRRATGERDTKPIATLLASLGPKA